MPLGASDLVDILSRITPTIASVSCSPADDKSQWRVTFKDGTIFRYGDNPKTDTRLTAAIRQAMGEFQAGAETDADRVAAAFRECEAQWPLHERVRALERGASLIVKAALGGQLSQEEAETVQKLADTWRKIDALMAKVGK